jgi:hypothetical protein
MKVVFYGKSIKSTYDEDTIQLQKIVEKTFKKKRMFKIFHGKVENFNANYNYN